MLNVVYRNMAMFNTFAAVSIKWLTAIFRSDFPEMIENAKIFRVKMRLF